MQAKMRSVFALFLLFAVVAGFGVMLTSCNRQIIDTTYKFEWAMLKLPSGELVIGQVDAWKDFQDGDQIQVKINGITYLTHACNVTLMTEKP